MEEEHTTIIKLLESDIKWVAGGLGTIALAAYQLIKRNIDLRFARHDDKVQYAISDMKELKLEVKETNNKVDALDLKFERVMGKLIHGLANGEKDQIVKRAKKLDKERQ